MTAPKFLQIHTLHSYTAALLNRDDSGQAKRLTYGDTLRTRISSQCLKRHWRMADKDPHALQKLTGYVDSFRSRELVTEKVIAPLKGRYPEEVVKALDLAFQKWVYGEKADTKKSRQTLLLGKPELVWLAAQAEKIAAAVTDAKGAEKAVTEWAKDKNFKAMSENAALPGGLSAALFGRMVTSDPAANIEAPVHVAHAFTVHAAEAEGDYFTAVDDLKRDGDDGGADTIQETELTCGLFYGYLVIDLPGLVGNCGGNKELSAGVVHNLIHLVAEVSPGAKLGSTAPYGRADLMLIESGDRQPRSLATAFRRAIPHDLERAVAQLGNQLALYDDAYATGESRRYLSTATTQLQTSSSSSLERLSLKTLAEWAASQIGDGTNA